MRGLETLKSRSVDALQEWVQSIIYDGKGANDLRFIRLFTVFFYSLPFIGQATLQTLRRDN